MSEIKFGPSGNEDIFYNSGHKSSFEAPSFLKSIGLNAYEYSFGRGYRMTEAMAEKIGDEAVKNNIQVSIHAPYYINFANPDEEMAEKSYNYVLTGLNLLSKMKGNHLVVHIGSLNKQTREVALENIRRRLIELAKRINFAGYSNLFVCFETMGKQAQVGTWKEIIDFCTLSENFIPAFDFGHIYALNTGNFGKFEDYLEIFNYAIEKLGFEKVKNCHIHFSKIQYSEKGEIRHLDYDNIFYGPNFSECARAIKFLNLTPTIICESASKMATDSLTYKNIYENV